MDIKTFLVVFGTVFVAELGDKTQLATVLFAAEPGVSRWTVFAAAAAALVTSAAIGVAAGAWISTHVSERILSLVAGSGFILIGLWTLARA
jgi:putative Ca2+/H+ antiporter (TMEM165/GDT1 family)